MFFKKKKKSVQEIFEFHYHNALKILKSSSVDFSSISPEATLWAAFDLVPVMYVVSDFAVLSAEKDRYAASEAIQNWLYIKMGKPDDRDALNQSFDCRVDFYGSIIRRRPLHGICFPGVDLSSVEDPLMRCSIAFTDCLLNPEDIDDYDNAPTPIYGIFKVVGVAESLVTPLRNELVSLYNDMYNNA